MVEIERKDGQILEPFFTYADGTMVRSYLQGHLGSGWVDRMEEPTCACIAVGDFWFLSGDAHTDRAHDLVQRIAELDGRPAGLILPQTEAWGVLIEKYHGDIYTQVRRYAFRKDMVFRIGELERIASVLPQGYELKRIDDKIYSQCMNGGQLEDLVVLFDSAADFMKRGRGWCVLYKGRPVCGASSYCIYDGEIEIEIDTLYEHRRKGLASACAARLILDCLEQSIYPVWDAANTESAALAKKLGYEMKEEYTVYMLTEYIMRGEAGV